MKILGMFAMSLTVTLAAGCASRPTPVQSPSGGRDVSKLPFSVDSPWNLPIATSAAYEGYDAPQSHNLNNPKHISSINVSYYTMPVYYASADDPLVEVHCVDIFDGTDYGRFTVRMPPGAKPCPGSDADLNVIDPDGVHCHELWFAKKIDATHWKCGQYHKVDLTASGLGTGRTLALRNGPRAYGGSSMGGLIRQYDVDQGVIRHGLALALENNQLFARVVNKSCVGFVWPACDQDNNACSSSTPYGGLNPIGTLAAIPPGVTPQSIGISSPAGLMLFHAAQDYGVYVVDRAGADCFYGEVGLSAAWVKQLNAEYACDKVRQNLVVVTNNSASTPGGGVFNGTASNRRAPLAPPIGSGKTGRIH